MPKRKKESKALAQQGKLSTPLTRTIVPPLQNSCLPLSPWLYSAILGNGSLLACLDKAGSIVQLFYPDIDAGPNIRSFLLGVQLSQVTSPLLERKQEESPSRGDSYGEGRVSWLASKDWVHKLTYLDGAPITRCIYSNAAASIQVEQIMAVHPSLNVCMLELNVTNNRTEPVNCRLVTYAGFNINHQKSSNCCFFDNETSLLTSFASDCYFSIFCNSSVHGYSCEKSNVDGIDHVFQNADRGKFSSIEFAIGQVNGAVSHDFGQIEAGGSTKRCMHLYFGRTWDEVLELHSTVEAQQPGMSEVLAWWQERQVQNNLSAASRTIERMYHRSMTILRLLTSRESGGVIAAPECDPDFVLSGGYGLCWPRDGAYISHALDLSGQFGSPRAFYEWALRVQPKSGIWYQRYYVDGKLGPIWGEQFDETGTVVWAICLHIQLSGDISYGHNVFPHLVRTCEDMQSALDPVTGLAPISKDLWEERDCISTYTCASTWAGFNELSKLSLKLGETTEAEHWASAADKLKAAIEDHLWDASLGRFLRAVRTKIYEHDIKRLRREPGFSESDIIQTEIAGKTVNLHREDATIDASILGLSIPFGVFSPTDPRMKATAEAIAVNLTSPVGGIGRYLDDHYIGANPWVICTLWLALQDLASGQNDRALKLYQWVVEHRTSLDLLPEQVSRKTGKPCWIVPLGWSHAMFILATQALATQGLLPQ